MKKSLKLVAAMSVMCTALHSQPYTGLNTYQHPVGPNLHLTDGNVTTYNGKGFILAGHLPSTTGSPIIYIDRPNVDGMYYGAPDEFKQEYKFFADPVKPCGGNLTGAATCFGVSVSEVKVGAPDWYLLAAAFDNGVVFSGLDMGGNAMPYAYFTFPVFAINKTKPLITPSLVNPGRYYICGSYQLNGIGHIYAMLVGVGGGIGWRMDYVTQNGAPVTQPTAMLESPYPTASGVPDVKVVGIYNDGSTRQDEGFFFNFDINTGAPGIFATYGSGLMSSSNERFLSLNLSSSTSVGNAGFTIGGYTDVNPAAGTCWMLKTDQFGNIQWSKVILPSTPTNGSIVGVTERFNTFGQYEYYGAGSENNAMSVFKLDEVGNIFSYGSLNNEFIYNDNVGGSGEPVALSFLDATSPNNEGIHIYGTNTPGAGDYFLTRACFNGAAGSAFGSPGCNLSNITLNTLPSTNVSNGPVFRLRSQVQASPGLPLCSQYGFGSNPINVNVVAPCNEYVLPTSPYGGNQSRMALATGIKANTAADKFSVSPNPVSDRLTIGYAANRGAAITIGLYNNLGQLVAPVITPEAMQGDNSLTLDLNKLSLNSGVYFVTIQMEGTSTTKKIIYTK